MNWGGQEQAHSGYTARGHVEFLLASQVLLAPVGAQIHPGTRGSAISEKMRALCAYVGPSRFVEPVWHGRACEQVWSRHRHSRCYLSWFKRAPVLLSRPPFL